jgi:hypothetical protein
MDHHDNPAGVGIARAPTAEALRNARSLDGHPLGEIRENARGPQHASAKPRFAVREKFANTGDAVAPQSVVKGTGPFMSVAHIHLVFWGAEWVGAAPPVDPLAVRAAIGSLCGSAFMQAAYDYCNYGSVDWKTFFMQSASEPPANFPDSSVSGLIAALFAAKQVPLPDAENLTDQFYVVFMPSTATSATAGAGGLHKFFTWTNPTTNKKTRVRFAWVLSKGNIDFLTSVFSHELVEAYTDPEGTFIQMQPVGVNSWNEVGDICASIAFVDGIAVQSYWSQKDQACVIPYYVDHGFPHGVPPTGARMRVTGIRRAFDKKHNYSFITEMRVQAPNGDVIHLSRTDALETILKKTNTYYVHGADGTEADVQIYTHPVSHNSYLATVPDASKADNLLSLPFF